MDASQEQTDVVSFASLELIAMAFAITTRTETPYQPRGRSLIRRQSADTDCTRDDGSRWRHARPEDRLRSNQARRFYR